jgi:ActR/RegA family two-component response regulator
MYRPPLRGRPTLADKKVLVIDRCQATREARAAVLRSHAVEVHEAERLSTARFLWQPNVYDLVMLDVRRYSSEETREFYEQIRAADPRQRIVFLTGPQSTCRIPGPVKSPRVTPRMDSGERQSSASWPPREVSPGQHFGNLT